MQENLEEKISMLLDNELSSNEAILVLEQINENEKLKEVWHRYNAIRSGLVTEPYRIVSDGFNDRISREIDDVNIVAGPWASTVSYAKWGYALAASIVVAVVFTWYQSLLIPTIPDDDRLAIIAPVPTPETILRMENSIQQPTEAIAQAGNNPQPLPNTSFARTAFDRKIKPFNRQSRGLDPRFKDYLVTHNQAASSTGVQGMLPYARVVTFESKQ